MTEPFQSFYKFLQTIAVFSKSEFDKSLSSFQLKTLEKDENWIKKGTTCREIAFIKSGMLRSFYHDSNGNEVTSCFCVSGQMSTSFKSFITQSSSHLTIVAVERSELVTINYSRLQSLYKSVPIWQEINRLIAEKEYLSLWNYAYSLNTETAIQKYLRLQKEQPYILQKAAVQDVASYLGITRETLSRIRKKIASQIM